MTKKELIYEGKAKTLFFYDNNKIIQYFKDDATAFNKKKHEIINEKGILNNFISEFQIDQVNITEQFAPFFKLDLSKISLPSLKFLLSSVG